ncbi:hypothetical protein Hanom_Chr09g00802471 [Helianthus anomalus]
MAANIVGASIVEASGSYHAKIRSGSSSVRSIQTPRFSSSPHKHCYFILIIMTLGTSMLQLALPEKEKERANVVQFVCSCSYPERGVKLWGKSKIIDC